MGYDDFNWDYRGYEANVAKAFVNKLEGELKDFLPISIEYQSIDSPKEYNFRNDSINVCVDIELPVLINLIKDRGEDAAKYFKERYTSCSGFISFHSNKLEDWLNESYIMESPLHRVGALLDCLASIEIDQDDIIYWADDAMYLDFWPKETEVNN